MSSVTKAAALVLIFVSLMLIVGRQKPAPVAPPQDTRALDSLRHRIATDSARHDSEMRQERRRTDSTLHAIRTAPRARIPAVVAPVIRPTPTDTTEPDVAPIDTTDLPEMLRECGDSLASIRPERDSLRSVDSLAGLRLQERTEAIRLCESRPAPVVEPVSRLRWAGVGSLATLSAIVTAFILSR